MTKSFTKDVTYLLIIGAPRSGTTLLASLISAHDEVAMLIEDRNFTIRKLTGKKILANKLCIPNQIELYSKSSKIILYLKKNGLFNKRSSSTYCINDYLTLPGIKIISIVRNPNYVISSIMERGGKDKKLAVYRWCRSVEIMDEIKSKMNENNLIVSFEQLVNQPEMVLKIISSFLNIEYQDKMLEGNRYNILYESSEKIDPSKAEQTNRFDFEIGKKHPKVFNKYKHLLSNSILIGDRVES